MTHVREERAGEEQAVARVIQAAFGQDEEVLLVARLRGNDELMLSLVAEADGEVVGHVGFAASRVQSGQESMAIAWLVPLSVAPAYQRRGIGAALVRAGLDACRNESYGHAIVVGDPAYYTRFGFSLDAAAGLESRWSEVLMAVALSDNPAPLRGAVIEPAAFAGLG